MNAMSESELIYAVADSVSKNDKNDFHALSSQMMDFEFKNMGNAINSHNLEEVIRLINSGMDVNITDAGGNTPLIIASALGYADIVGYLLAHNANVNAVNGYNMTAIMVVSEFNSNSYPYCDMSGTERMDIVSLILEYDPDLTIINSNPVWTAIESAIFSGYGDLAKLLRSQIEKNTIKSIRQYSCRGLHESWPAKRTNLKLIHENYQDLALMDAVYFNDKDKIKELINHGCDINKISVSGAPFSFDKNGAGCTPLIFSLIKKYSDDAHDELEENDIDLIEYLLKNGADVNIPDEQGYFPIDHCSELQFYSAGKLILSHYPNNLDYSINLVSERTNPSKKSANEYLNLLKNCKEHTELKRLITDENLDDNPSPLNF